MSSYDYEIPHWNYSQQFRGTLSLVCLVNSCCNFCGLQIYKYFQMSVKGTKRELIVKIIHQVFESCLSKNQKVNFWIFYCFCHKKEVRRRIIFLWCCKEAKCLTNLDLGFILEFIRERGFRSYIEFLFIVDEQRTAGQMDIAEFVFKRNEKILRELVTKIGKWSQRKKN